MQPLNQEDGTLVGIVGKATGEWGTATVFSTHDYFSFVNRFFEWGTIFPVMEMTKPYLSICAIRY